MANSSAQASSTPLQHATANKSKTGMDNTNTEQTKNRRFFWKVGEPLVWATGAALGMILMITFIIIAVIVTNGIGVFWPSDIVLLNMKDKSLVMGEITQTNINSQNGKERIQLKVGNRDIYSLDFRWVNSEDIESRSYPEEIIVAERMEYGNFYGYLKSVSQGNTSTSLWDQFMAAQAIVEKELEAKEEIDSKIAKFSAQMESVHHDELKLKYNEIPTDHADYKELLSEKEFLEKQFAQALVEQQGVIDKAAQYTVTFADASGETREIPLMDVVRIHRPNEMSTLAKVGFYLEKLGELLTDEPREANTEGGLFPAIFGTVLMVIIMSMLSFPLGVITAIYLREYAKDGVIVRTVRIAVNNLAGIPSIVYGVFGLGFFVYGVGGGIDALFFPERLPTPTFGTGGILWASLTLGLLTVPVVIVTTEEALGSVPGSMREASLALGATKLQTLVRIILPMASPGIMTGFILAMARAAGEVAPLMITGVVKLAPALPIDGAFPYIHLERKFMHLGFHIFDVGFQSPNVEAAKPMVFVTTLLLVMIVLLMSSVAIYLRNQMRKRYTLKAF